jgi:hypothetical protein
MKEFQLRKIIKESIKELMLNEQTGSCATGQNTAVNSMVGGAIAAGFPFTGAPGITSQFITNMAGKPTAFYNQRMTAFMTKKQLLMSSQYSFCNGENPQWQANLVMKMNYAQHCKNNPGTC